MSTAFPEQIDNTMLVAWRSCRRKAHLRFFRHRASNTQSIHLHAGRAFAAGLETARLAFYQHGLSAESAVAAGWRRLLEEYGDADPGRHTNKSAHRMGEALISYFDEYPLDTDDITPLISAASMPAVEFDFALPLPVAHPVTGQPILYCGRFDMLGITRGGQIHVVDEKTTSSLGEYWSKRFELSSQFTGYCWAARQHGYSAVGAIVRGIGLLKTEIRHAAIPLLRPKFMIDEWYNSTLATIYEMIECWKSNEFMPNLGDACASYGGCEFMDYCTVSPESREKILEINYTTQEWNPLKFEEEA